MSVKFSSPRPHPAQVFPGDLHIISVEFVAEMRNRSSPIFQKTAAYITAAVGCELSKEGEQLKKAPLFVIKANVSSFSQLREALRNEPGYSRSEVVQLE